MLASVVALLYAGLASADNGGLLPPDPHSPNASRISDAYIFVLVFTGVIFVLVEGALVAFAVRYRRRRRPRTADGPQIHGATRLEIIWTVLPVLALVAIGSYIFYKLPGISDAPAASAADETEIVVEGHQFYWLFRYPNAAVSINTMVAPADTVVRQPVVAPDEDVNHSWWVPELGGKIDAIAGQTNHTWFKADEGEYVARCAELCGIQHAKMTGLVRVVPREEYESFIAQRRDDVQGLGEEEFEQVCRVCHRLDERFIGPQLRDNPLLADRDALGRLVRNGRGDMPPVGAGWTDAQIDALVAYTKTLVSDGDQG